MRKCKHSVVTCHCVVMCHRVGMCQYVNCKTCFYIGLMILRPTGGMHSKGNVSSYSLEVNCYVACATRGMMSFCWKMAEGRGRGRIGSSSTHPVFQIKEVGVIFPFICLCIWNEFTSISEGEKKKRRSSNQIWSTDQSVCYFHHYEWQIESYPCQNLAQCKLEMALGCQRKYFIRNDLLWLAAHCTWRTIIHTAWNNMTLPTKHSIRSNGCLPLSFLVSHPWGESS